MADKSMEKRKRPTPEPAVDLECGETMVYYFQLSNDEMQYLDKLSPFEKTLLSFFSHTFRLGVHLDQQNMERTAEEIDETAAGGSACERYISTALASDKASDKYFPLRLTGPSMKRIIRLLPPQNVSIQATSAKYIFQLCIWRIFAFGNQNHIEELHFGQQSSPDLSSIADTIQTWGGISNIAMPAYGNFQVIKAKVPEMLQLLWDFSQALSTRITARTSPMTFAELQESLCKKAVPSIPRGGIIMWLLISDFSEYGFCLPPTERDLAEHIIPSQGSHGSPSGPSDALKHVARQSNEQVPKDVNVLAEILRKVLEVFKNPPQHMGTIQKLVRDCEEAQGRKLGVSDLEHALCKIARQVKLAVGGGRKKQRV